MGIFSTSSPFDQDVERATSETKTNEDWGLMMEICDRAGASASAAKDCLRAVLRRLGHPDPHVQVHAATLLAACVANCGRLFHLEVASRDFETEFRRLVSRAQPPVQRRLRAMLRDWAEGEFRDDPQLDLIPSLHAKLRAEAGESGAPTSAPTSAPALAPTSATQLSAVQREQEDLARAIALSLREAAPAPTAAPATSTAASLYPRVESNEGSALAAVPAPAPAPAPRKVRALYDFEAAEDNELTFYAGETVYVTDSSDPNWWKGHNERGEGLFPANFVSGEAEAEAGAAPAATAANELVAEVEADEAPPTSIDEATMDEALALLHEADPGAPAGPEEARLVRLEARAHAMGALVDAALERADRRHARLTQLSADLVDALNLYHTLMRDPHPHPHSHPPPPPPPTMGGFAPHPPRAPHAFPPAPPPPQPRC